MKKSAILTLLFFILYVFSPFGNLINFKKNYTYENEESGNILNMKEVYLRESSNFKLAPKIDFYKTTLKNTFNKEKNTIIFKFKKDGIKNTSDTKINLFNGDKKISVNIDDDGDERMLKDEYYFTEPVFIDSTREISYEIESKQNISGTKLYVVGIDTKSYNEKIEFSLDGIASTNAANTNIVSRAEWGADETLRYENNPIWIKIYENNRLASLKPKTTRQIQQEEKTKNIRAYLASNFPEQDTPVKTIKEENGKSLVWNIEKTKKVEKIVIHHTAGEYSDAKDDKEIMRGIYYYHTITRGWGDIGYQYLVGKDGKIYEGRAGGDYVVAAHTLWNNKSTVGISVLGNFEKNQISQVQKNGIEEAVQFLAKKYGIDVNKTSIGHKECSTNDCLLKDYEVPNLIGHKDIGYTTCPGNNLYTNLGDIKYYELAYTRGLSYIENKDIDIVPVSNLPKGPSIKIRLSYTGNEIDIKSFVNEKMKISLGKKSGYVSGTLKFETKGTDKLRLYYKNKKYSLSNLKIESSVLEIPSWSRTPAWDTKKQYNDNKFRGSLYVYNDNGVLTVVNELPLEDYLKGLAEISNNDNVEKVKSILVSARSYAMWYTNTANRKFPGKIYDGSDNPDEFQKYLGYSYEQRSPNISRLVDETNNIIIKYSGKPIKPWYFNQSNGVTKSYKDYCEQRKKDGSLPASTVCEDVPYLQSVVDPAGNIAEGYKGHGVGLSGAGASYLAEFENYKYDEIIKYFYKGVTVEKAN
ncbi:N-acetylmuramoyl-L-alanine amidase [Candidatus Gracilibacteria bacterium]|nr:N-acetylmuramoyl-L-alanine amidase [Candidatus Gracilibacteria bacterium]